MAGPFPKECPSCHIVYRRAGWELLPHVGVQDIGEGEWIELRNCPCGSTIAIEIAPPEKTRPNRRRRAKPNQGPKGPYQIVPGWDYHEFSIDPEPGSTTDPRYVVTHVVWPGGKGPPVAVARVARVGAAPGLEMDELHAGHLATRMAEDVVRADRKNPNWAVVYFQPTGSPVGSLIRGVKILDPATGSVWID